MTQQWNYIPIFKTTIASSRELTDEDFGKIVRAVADSTDLTERPQGFSDLQYMFFKVLADDAMRVYAIRESREAQKARRKKAGGASSTSRTACKPAEKKTGYRPPDLNDEIDPDEAFRRAIARSFGEDF